MLNVMNAVHARQHTPLYKIDCSSYNKNTLKITRIINFDASNYVLLYFWLHYVIQTVRNILAMHIGVKG